MESLVFRRVIGLCASLLIGGALLVLAAPASAAPSSTPDATYVTNGQVVAIARSGNTIYLGGLFTEVGPRTGPLVRISAASGAFDPTLPQVSGGEGTIDPVISDGAGGEYIGGPIPDAGWRRQLRQFKAPGPGQSDAVIDPAVDPVVVGRAHSLQVPLLLMAGCECPAVDLGQLVIIYNLEAAGLHAGQSLGR